MRTVQILVALAVALAPPAASMAAPPSGYLSASSKLGDLLADPSSRAVLDKHLPGISTDRRTRMARGMTLREMQARAPKQITDATIAKIDAELAKLPVRKP